MREQEGFPAEKVGAFVGLAQKFITDGVDTPAKLAAVIGEFGERTGRDLRHYSQALWDALGMVNPALRGTHDWAAVYAPAATADDESGTADEAACLGNRGGDEGRSEGKGGASGNKPI